jgi:hypothetical protein
MAEAADLLVKIKEQLFYAPRETTYVQPQPQQSMKKERKEYYNL